MMCNDVKQTTGRVKSSRIEQINEIIGLWELENWSKRKGNERDCNSRREYEGENEGAEIHHQILIKYCRNWGEKSTWIS